MKFEVMSFAGVPIRTGTTLDYPTAWAIQKEVGASLTHDPECSSRPGWGLLCDCGAVEREWERRSANAKA